MENGKDNVPSAPRSTIGTSGEDTEKPIELPEAATSSWQLIMAQSYGATFISTGPWFTAYAVLNQEKNAWGVHVLPYNGYIPTVADENEYRAWMGEKIVTMITLPTFRTHGKSGEAILTWFLSPQEVSSESTLNITVLAPTGEPLHCAQPFHSLDRYL